MGLGRFELPTSPLSGVRSNQLSYRPDSTAPGELPQRGVPAGAQAALNRALSKGFEDTVERAIAATPLLTIGVDLTGQLRRADRCEKREV